MRVLAVGIVRKELPDCYGRESWNGESEVSEFVDLQQDSGNNESRTFTVWGREKK